MTEETKTAVDPFEGMTPEQINLLVSGMTEADRFNENEVSRNPVTGRIMKGGDGSDEELNVHFSVEPTFSKLETYKNKGVPAYVDQEFITIEAPGQLPQARTTVHTPVTDYYIWRFPNEYKRFKDGLAEQVAGTPITLWTAVSPSFAKELANQGIRTVEQLANLSDSASGALRSFHVWKQKAKQFLDMANDAAARGALQAELDARDTAAKATQASMQAQIDQLVALMQAQHSKPEVEPEDKKATKAK